MRDALRHLPPLFNLVEKFDFGERLEHLYLVSLCVRNGLPMLENCCGWRFTSPSTKRAIELAAAAGVDWDEVLRVGNSFYDGVVDAYRQPNRAQRRESIRKIADETKKATEEARDVGSFALAVSRNPRRAVSERLGRILLAEASASLYTANFIEDSAAIQIELVKLAFAVAVYRADHDAYPATLADLVPKYVAEVPKDIYSGADVHYHAADGGYLLYSVGVNGKDDGGRTYTDRREAGDDFDDIVVRVHGETNRGN